MLLGCIVDIQDRGSWKNGFLKKNGPLELPNPSVVFSQVNDGSMTLMASRKGQGPQAKYLHSNQRVAQSNNESRLPADLEVQFDHLHRLSIGRSLAAFTGTSTLEPPQ